MPMTTSEASDHAKLFDSKLVGVWPVPKTVKLEVNCTTPKILVPPRIAADITRIVKLVAVEVGWYCAVRRLPGQTYLLYDIYLPKQKVSGVTNEFDESDLGEWQTGLAMKGNEGEQLANDFQLCWMHSHHTMVTEPSVQDDEQCKEAGAHGAPFIIRGIANKEGEIRFDIFYFGELHITFLKLPWELDANHICDIPPSIDWEAEIKSKVELKPLVRPKAQEEEPDRTVPNFVSYGWDRDNHWPTKTVADQVAKARSRIGDRSSTQTPPDTDLILIPSGPLHCENVEEYERLLVGITEEQTDDKESK